MKFQFISHTSVLRGLDLHAVLADVCRQWPEFKSDRFHIITVDNTEPDDRILRIDLMVADDGKGVIPTPASEPWDTEPLDYDAWLAGFERKDHENSGEEK